MTDTTIFKFPNSGGYLLQSGKIECTDQNNIGKKQKFIESTKQILQQVIQEQLLYLQ